MNSKVVFQDNVKLEDKSGKASDLPIIEKETKEWDGRSNDVVIQTLKRIGKT